MATAEPVRLYVKPYLDDSRLVSMVWPRCPGCQHFALRDVVAANNELWHAGCYDREHPKGA